MSKNTRKEKNIKEKKAKISWVIRKEGKRKKMRKKRKKDGCEVGR